MSVKNDNRKKARSAKLGRSICLCLCALCLSCLAQGLSAAPDDPQNARRQLDPLDLLPANRTARAKDVNTTDTTMQIATPQTHQLQQQQTPPTITNFAAQIENDLAESEIIISRNPHTQFRNQLWQAKTGPIKPDDDSENKTQLQDIIERIHALEFESPPQAPEQAITIEPVPEPDDANNEPNEPEPDQNLPDEPEDVKHTLPYQLITEQTLQLIDTFKDEPNNVQNPFELAEVLFQSKKITQATKWYHQALAKQGDQKTGQTQDTDWILLQIGNCLKKDDLAGAVDAYDQLITRFPQSQWAELAKAQALLLQWRKDENPKELISQYKARMQNGDTSSDKEPN